MIFQIYKNTNIYYDRFDDNIFKYIMMFSSNFQVYNDIRIASYKKIILLDDDCIPSPNFIKLYLEDFSNITEDVIL